MTKQRSGGKNEAARQVLVKLARREKFATPSLNKARERVDALLKKQPRLTERQLTRRAGL